MAYCTYTDIGVALGLTFSASSIPTAVQVTDIISQVDAEINMRLLSIGIVSPDTTLTTMLKKYSVWGSAGQTALTYFFNNNSVDNSQGEYYLRQYKEFLSDVVKHPEVYGAGSGVNTIIVGNQVTDGTDTESNINSKFDFLDDLVV